MKTLRKIRKIRNNADPSYFNAELVISRESTPSEFPLVK